MKDLLTPKQVARAVDVSESSIKRWCDRGVIPTQYTAGGHRRITKSGLFEFLRRGKHNLVYPEALGLPPTSGQTSRMLDRSCARLTEALLEGQRRFCAGRLPSTFTSLSTPWRPSATMFSPPHS